MAEHFFSRPSEQTGCGLVPADYARFWIEADNGQWGLLHEGLEQTGRFLELLFSPLALGHIFTDDEDEDLIGMIVDRPRTLFDPYPDSVFPDFLNVPLKHGVGTGGACDQLSQHGLVVFPVK